jgi:hypothetical protein
MKVNEYLPNFDVEAPVSFDALERFYRPWQMAYFRQFSNVISMLKLPARREKIPPMLHFWHWFRWCAFHLGETLSEVSLVVSPMRHLYLLKSRCEIVWLCSDLFRQIHTSSETFCPDYVFRQKSYHTWWRGFTFGQQVSCDNFEAAETQFNLSRSLPLTMERHDMMWCNFHGIVNKVKIFAASASWRVLTPKPSYTILF